MARFLGGVLLVVVSLSCAGGAVDPKAGDKCKSSFDLPCSIDEKTAFRCSDEGKVVARSCTEGCVLAPICVSACAQPDGGETKDLPMCREEIN